MTTQDIIIKPLISEQSLKEASFGKYTFLVNEKANKTEIRKAIEEVFSVKVVDIKTNITKGTTIKNTRVGRKFKKFSNKKARVALDKGQSISIFDEHLGLDDKKTSSSAKATEGQGKKDKKEGKKEKGENK